MKISVAQTRPIKGNIEQNIIYHLKLINLAVANGAEMIVFPELSITGYEPSLAKNLATTPEDKRFGIFQQISDIKQIIIGVGVPTKSSANQCFISMVIFQPNHPTTVYSKRYLHPDEDPYFICGQSNSLLEVGRINIALAICYEISIPEHAEDFHKRGAQICIASVAKSRNGIEKALERLSEIAQKYSVTVLMANSVGESDGMECAGKSSAWNNKGLLAGQLDPDIEGILMIDTETKEVVKKPIEKKSPLPNA